MSTSKHKTNQDCPDDFSIDLGEESLHQRIAEAAYYMAESRGFCGGDPQEDWLKAEANVLESCKPCEQQPSTTHSIQTLN